MLTSPPPPKKKNVQGAVFRTAAAAPEQETILTRHRNLPPLPFAGRRLSV